MCWELVNHEWTVWMPARLLQSLSVAERGVSFQDCRSLAIRNLQGRHTFATKCLRMALSCATVVPHFIWCVILQSYKRYVTIFAIVGNENGMAIHQTNFSRVVKNGLETRLTLTWIHNLFLNDAAWRLSWKWYTSSYYTDPKSYKWMHVGMQLHIDVLAPPLTGSSSKSLMPRPPTFFMRATRELGTRLIWQRNQQ